MRKFINNDNLKEGDLNNDPEFYKSLAQTPSVGRLRGIDVKANLPYIVEFIKGVAFVSMPVETFSTKLKFTEPPLVLGLLETTLFGQKVCQQLLPSSNALEITTTQVKIKGPTGLGISIGDKYFLRVYNVTI